MIYSKQLSMILCAVLIIALFGWYAIVPMQGSLTQQSQSDPVFPDDQDMQAAYNKAQDQLDYFLELAADPPRETQGFAIKARIEENQREEFFWLYPFENTAAGFAGRINDDPTVLLKTFKGDIVEFDRKDIVDWTFDDTRLNVMHGNFTGCVELTRQAPENAKQFQEFFGLDCTKLGELR